MINYKVITNPYGVPKAVKHWGKQIGTYSAGIIVRRYKDKTRGIFGVTEYVANDNLIGEI